VKAHLLAWMEAVEKLLGLMPTPQSFDAAQAGRYHMATCVRVRGMLECESGDDLRPKPMNNVQTAQDVRARIVADLRRRADKREESLVTADNSQEVHWLRSIASMIQDGTEGLE